VSVETVSPPTASPEALAAARPRGRFATWARSDRGAHAASIVTGLVFWQLLGMRVDRIPTPPEVADFFWTVASSGVLWAAFANTLDGFFLGLAIALVVGIALGLALGLSGIVRAFLNDIVVVGLAVPGVIWSLLVILWFGFSFKAPVAAVALTATPFIAVQVAQGVRGTPRDLVRMSTAFGIPWHKRIRHLVLPSVMDYVFAGFRFGVIMGWNAVLLAEWFGGREGVGFQTRSWYDANDFTGFVSWVLFFIVFIVLLDRLVLERVARRTFRWRTAATPQPGGGA
jgi:ABC-type nitrate/sulfonate/bicarbonate transport system permease component